MKSIKIFLFCTLILFVSQNIQAAVPVVGTTAHSFLTNKVFWAGLNFSLGSNTKVTNVHTNAGGEFLQVSADRSNGLPGMASYFTNSIRNWGNATDTFILSTADTNTNSGCASPWQVWFETLSGSRITNIKIGSGKTNSFRLVIRPSVAAQTQSYVEYKLVAKSSNSQKVPGINVSVYTGDNKFIYGGPTNTGLGRGPVAARYITVSSQTPRQNNEFIRLTIMTISNYYVNDGSTSGDVFCSATGDDANSGVSPGSPKATLTNLLATYNIEPGNTVYIDRGVYRHSTRVFPQDRGSAGRYVHFLGAGATNTVFNTTNCNFGIKFTNIAYIKIRNLSVIKANNQNLYYDFSTNCILTNIRSEYSKGDGIFCYETDRLLFKQVIVRKCTNTGINLYYGSDKNSLYQVTNSACYVGIRMRSSSSNVLVNSQVSSNRSHGLYITNTGFCRFTNNYVFQNSGDGFSFPGGDDEVLFKNRSCRNGVTGISLYTNTANFCDRNFFYRNDCLRNSTGFYIYGDRNVFFSNVTATNSQDGIQQYGATNFFRQNQIFSNHSSGIWLGGARGVIISNNYIYKNSGNGVGCAGLGFAKTVNNGIFQNGQSGIAFWGGCYNHLIKYNFVSRNNENGMYINGDRNSIISNVFCSNNNNGIHMAGSTGYRDCFTNLFNLLFRNTYNGLLVEDVSNTIIRNNTLLKNGRVGIKLMGGFRGSSSLRN
ncbi:MAG: NosD domain-containing protein, partial [bacterium]|nr:NosD domain-containing protein [bacterium]